MLVRVAFGVGLLALGYYVGREVGRNESLRRALDQGGPPVNPSPGAARGDRGGRAGPEAGSVPGPRTGGQ